ncbi:hypothetical protein O8B39_21985 [Agrobacterium rhizogenes]|nr:hypothetical protein [Rhizobium rhizogenes]
MFVIAGLFLPAKVKQAAGCKQLDGTGDGIGKITDHYFGLEQFASIGTNYTESRKIFYLPDQ